MNQNGHKVGRPTKYTPEIIDKVISAIALGAPFTHACNYAGVSFETFNEWRKQYPEFSEQVKTAEGRAVEGWLSKIEKAASDGNWQAAAWKLERRYPEDFGKRERLQLDVREIDSEIERRLAELASRSKDSLIGETESRRVN